MALNEELNKYPGLKGGKAPKEKKIPPLARIIIGGGLTTGVLGLSGCGPSSTEIRPTPTPEPEAQPTNLVFTLAKEKQNDPDFQKLNQANTSFFQEFKNRNPQNPWQLGETVALGAGNVDYALTTVFGPNGEPILGVVSYLDKDGGRLQSGFAIDFVTTIPSDDGGRTFGGIYPLTPEISQLLLEGKTVTIDPKKDTQGPIFGFVLRQGKNWTDFYAAMNQATTEEQRQRVFSSYVDEIYLQEPDGKTHLFSISKLSPSEQTQLVSYALPTATPAPDTIELTPNPKPSLTPTITPTPQPSPTPEPTPIPTIEVSGLQLPDPRITNPELFDLKKKEAPIPQFANALKNAGIELSPEQIAQGITYISTKEDGTPLVDKDGNPFVVAVYNLDPSLFPPQYRDLAGPVPLMIAKKGENGEWRWKKLVEKDVSRIPIGSEIKPTAVHRQFIPQHFNAVNLMYDTEWINMEPTPGNILDENPKKWAFLKTNLEIAERNQMYTLAGPLFYSVTYPDWVNNLTPQQMREAIHRRTEYLLTNYPQIDFWIGLNEYFPTSWGIKPDVIQDKLGYYDFLDLVYLTAQNILDRNDNNALLIYNYDHNHSISGHKLNSSNYPETLKHIKRLKAMGVRNIAAGLQMHINATYPPTKDEIIKAMKSYGVPVVITELDVDISDFATKDRLLKQAQIYRTIFEAALESDSCKGIFMFQIGDRYSWLETDLGKSNADPTPYDDNLNPKISAYVIRAVLFNDLLRFSQ